MIILLELSVLEIVDLPFNEPAQSENEKLRMGELLVFPLGRNAETKKKKGGYWCTPSSGDSYQKTLFISRR